MSYIKTLGVIAILFLFSPFAKADGILVLVELNKTPDADPADPTKKPTNYYTGTLLKPLQVDTGKAVLDLTDVLVLTFPNKTFIDKKNALDEKIKNEKDNDKLVSLQKQLKDLYDDQGNQKDPVEVRAVTQYSPPIYEGSLNDAKVKFTIKKDATTGGGKITPPQTVHPSAIKAIYFLPPPPPPPAKAGKASTSSNGKDGRGDPWLAVSSALGVLQKERKFLVGQFSNLARQRVAVCEMSGLEWNNDLRHILHEKVKHLENVQEKIKNSIEIKDILIEQYQIQLAFLPQPRQQLMAEANEDTTTVARHQLFFMDGAHFAQVNDFGDGPYLSSSRYAKVAPGMKLTVQSDGHWKLEYNMLTMSGPVQAFWELKIRYEDEFGVPREIPLQTFTRPIYQTKDTDKIQNVWHSGNHPAIREHFVNITNSGCLLRKGHIRFETDTGDNGEDNSN